nr:hypothetical protein [Halobacterium wangiae]
MLSLDLVVAIGLDQFVGRGRIVLALECFIELVESPTRVARHRLVLSGTVTYFLSLPFWLASLFVRLVLASALVVIWHGFH